VELTIKTVEKVPSQKLTIAKWDKSIEKHLIVLVLRYILASFEPVVGDLYENFSSKGFINSLVGRT